MNPTNFIVSRFNVDPKAANYVPPGWTGIVFDALEKIKSICEATSINQVKVKFGYLTIYYTIPDYIRNKTSPIHHEDTCEYIIKTTADIVSEAVELALEACEECGLSAKRGRYGSFCNLCLRIKFGS